MVKKYSKRIFCFLLGCFIIQMGVAFFVNANTGGDSAVVLLQGISAKFNVTVGMANILFMLFAFILLLIFDRSKISLGTFLAVFGSGIFLDIINIFIIKLSVQSLPILVRLLIVAASCVVIAIGFSIQKSTNLGVAPHDEIPFLIGEFIKIEYRWIRIGLDVSYVVIGFLLGGVVGFGTIIATLLLGPCIQFFLPILEKPLNNFINEESVLVKATVE